MKSKHKVIHDFNLSLIADFFKGLERQGPGSEQVTKLALQFIGNLSDTSSITDIGCGTGGQTIFLANNLKGHITAVDFLPEFIESLDRQVKREHLTNRITTVVGGMANLDFSEQSLDLIWAEGSIYNIGYQKGLKEWRKFLKPGGYIAVSEASWFTNNRPQEISDFWNRNYPEIDTISKKVQQMQDAGYNVIAHFILPEICWRNYFNPILEYCDTFIERHNHSEAAKGLVSQFKEEIELYNKYKDYYGYVFYIGQINDICDNEEKPVQTVKTDDLGINIRPEKETEYPEIYNLIQTAFETAKVKDGDEQDFANGLRAGEGYIPELALVAEIDGKLAGHIMLTKTYVETPVGKSEFLLLAPISVLMEHRDKGVGAALIKKSFEVARSMGYKAVFLCGDPEYYHRFGFKAASHFGIKPKGNIPEQYVMVFELEPWALDAITGVVECC